jgi:hypothetical protein
MALFTDATVTSIEDLRGHDTQLLSVANVEDIDVTRKLELAREELSVEIWGMLDQLTTAGQLTTPPSIRQVVATAPLKLWYVYRTLEMVYADAYNSQLNDRYAGKREEYRDMAKWARNQVVQSGLGVVEDPVEQAAAPDVQASGGDLPDGTYYVAVAWTNAAGEEGASSVPAVIKVSGTSFAVRTAAPSNVKGWNIYSGAGPTTMTRQNGAVLAPVASWVQPDTPSTSGRPAGSGQAPSYLVRVPRTIQRG